MSTRYNVGCATDKNYAQHLGIMLYSMLANTASPELFDLYIVDGGIVPEDIKRLEQLSSRFGCKLTFLKPDRKYFEGLKVFEIYSEATYYRYFLLDTTPVDRLLFLDCDMVVEGDVVELYNTDLEGNIMAAAPEVLTPRKHLAKLKLDKSFNAGMLLVDCKKWQEHKISQRAVEYQLKWERILEYPDQDSLNVTLKDHWKVVPYRWNVIARVGLVKIGIGRADYRICPKDELFREYHHPKIIHYANRLFKPWFWLDPTPYKKNYWHYKKLSPWHDVPVSDRSVAGVFKRIRYYFTFVLKYASRYYITNK